MVALITGFALIVAAVLLCLPGLFNWWGSVVEFLKGMVPVLALLSGVIAVLIGVADLRDKKEAELDKDEEEPKAGAK